MNKCVYTKPSNLDFHCNWIIWCFYLSLEKCFDNKESVKERMFEGNWADTWPKNCLLRQSESFPFFLQTPTDDLSFWWIIWLKKISSLQKLLISKTDGFLMSNFDLNQIRKTVLTQNLKLGTLTQLNCFIFLLKIREMLWTYRKCQRN